MLVANGLMEMCETAEQVRYVVSSAAMLHKMVDMRLAGLRGRSCASSIAPKTVTISLSRRRTLTAFRQTGLWPR